MWMIWCKFFKKFPFLLHSVYYIGLTELIIPSGKFVAAPSEPILYPWTKHASASRSLNWNCCCCFVKNWNCFFLQALKKFKDHFYRLHSGTNFAAGMNDGDVRIVMYDVGVIKPTRKFTNVHNGCPCNALCVNNDRIISGGQDGTINAISLEDSSVDSISSVRLLYFWSILEIDFWLMNFLNF